MRITDRVFRPRKWMQAVIAAWVLSTNLMGNVSASEDTAVVLGVNPANA